MFDVVANVKGCTAAGTLRNRANRPECTRELRALGAPALIPMLQALALESAGRAYATETEKLAYARGLIEATMVLRDPRARGVMTAILRTQPTEACKSCRQKRWAGSGATPTSNY